MSFLLFNWHMQDDVNNEHDMNISKMKYSSYNDEKILLVT